MSVAELERFAAAVKADPALVESYNGLTAGQMAARLRDGGYDVTDEEVSEAERRGTELSDEDLDGVAGGSLLGLAAVGLALGGGAAVVGAVAGVLIGVDALNAHVSGQKSQLSMILGQYKR